MRPAALLVAIAISFVCAGFMGLHATAQQVDKRAMLALSSSGGELWVVATGKPSTVFFDYWIVGCGAKKRQPCIMVSAHRGASSVASISAPRDCTVSAGVARCAAADFTSVAFNIKSDGRVTLYGGTGVAANCAPVPLYVTLFGKSGVDSWSGCHQQSITCAEGSLASVTANAWDAVSGPCRKVVRR